MKNDHATQEDLAAFSAAKAKAKRAIDDFRKVARATGQGCPDCGAEVGADYCFCAGCGKDLRSLMTVCSHCHVAGQSWVLKKTPNYCTQCGEPWRPVPIASFYGKVRFPSH